MPFLLRGGMYRKDNNLRKNRIITFFDLIDALGNQINKIIKVILFLLSVPLVAIILYSVFMRYVLNMAPTWSEELARYLMIWIGFLALPVALKEGKHIGLTFALEKIPTNCKSYVYLIADFFILFFSIFIFWQGVTMTKFVVLQRSPSMFIPMWIPYLSLPIGSFLMSLYMIIKILKQFGSIIFKISEG